MTNELTVRVERPVIPAMNWNKDEVQKNLDELLASYTGRVYTPESIKDAKADRAAVNKWDKQLAAALTAAKRLYTDPLEDFQKSIREMQAQCKKISGAIDQQVKAVEQAQREEKASTLRLVYRDCIGELEPLISFDRLLVPQWLNKTFDLAQAEKELRKAVETRREELRLIRETCGEDAEPCITEYLRALSVNDALHEHSRREHARAAQAEAEAQRQAAERTRAAAPVIIPPTEEERQLKEEAAQKARSNAFVTASGRLDCEVLQQFALPGTGLAPARKRYRFWVDFTPEDIEWFKAEAKKRGFAYGSVK